jgi:hypothetical protein
MDRPLDPDEEVVFVTVDGVEVPCQPYPDFEQLNGDWWIRCVSPDGEVVYDGLSPVPPELCTITLEDVRAGRFFEFHAFPVSMLN